MDEIPTFPPVPNEHQSSAKNLRRRRHVLPTAAVVLALGAGATGIGYAAGLTQGSPAAAAAPGTRSSTSSDWFMPGDAYGQYGDGTQQYGDPQQYGAPDTEGGQSADTTTKADQSQLTGLVRIVSTMKYAGAQAAGTGLVLTSDGEVVTNHHVVEGATSVEVTVMSTGASYTARVVGTDPTSDVAVLQLQDASGLDTVTADQDSVTTGDQVTAVGDGNGTVDYLSAAAGQVIAQDQSITTQSEGTASSESLTGLIEISSDVVGGYSGGATYDAEGEVLGMTTAASSGTSDIVGYAIPIATVLHIADDLESGVKSSDYVYGYPAFLGVGLAEGTTVGQVYDGTGAADAGLAAGDTITSIDGRVASTTAQLRAVVAAHQPGDNVGVSWTDQAGSRHTTTLALGQGPVR